MITLATGSVAEIIGYATTLFEDFKFLILLLIGLPLGFWILEMVVGALAPGFRKNKNE